MNKLVLYGDSNTYGYDPRGFLGMRYSAEVRWADIVARELQGKYKVINEGMNGRPLPEFPWDEQFFELLIRDLGARDILLMMLGTNDILLTNHPNADVPIRKMESLLNYKKLTDAAFRFVVVAPPYIGSEGDEMRRYYEESVKMNAGFAKLCEVHGVDFIDAGSWGVPLAFDRAHLSEEGHGLFAEHLLEELRKPGKVEGTDECSL